MNRNGRGPRDPVARFRDHLIVQSDGCWTLDTVLHTTGYASFWWRDAERRVHNSGHRFSYLMFVGPIPEGLCLDHLCRNRACVNPEHLEAVTPRENIMRGEGLAAENAAKTHCHRGHPFDEANTMVRATGRACRACSRASALKRARENGVRPFVAPTHCKHGHEFTSENTYRPAGANGRKCRTCHAIFERERRKQRRLAA